MAVLTKASLPPAQQAAVTTIEGWRPESRKGITIEDIPNVSGVIRVTTLTGQRRHFIDLDGFIHTLRTH